MTIDVSGGAGGVGAHYDDMLSLARVLDAGGDEVRDWTDDVAGVAADGSVLASALLCPLEAGAVELAVAGAAANLLTVSTGLEASSVLLKASVTTYQFVDEAQQQLIETLHVVRGYAIGAALPGLALGAAGLLAANPALAASLFFNKDKIGSMALEGLYDNPWLMNEIVSEAPWLVQGLASHLGPLGILFSGGKWPTANYEDSVAGLLSAGNCFGLLNDSGDFEVVPADIDNAKPGDVAEAPTSVQDVFTQQGKLGQQDNKGQIQISRVVGADGTESYVVQIPGTQDWALSRSNNLVDFTTNVQLMSGQETQLQEQVTVAMRDAGIDPGDPVMLTGHSQGGILCAAMASDSQFTDEFNVQSIVTGGSPIARYDIPSDISVLSVEHEQDVVPMLDGSENPDRANWVTVKRDVSGDVHMTPNPAEAHGTQYYATTGQEIDESTDPSLVAWRDENENFFDTSATTDVMRYQIQPTTS